MIWTQHTRRRAGFTRALLVIGLAVSALANAQSPRPASTLAHGLIYRHEDIPEGPWSIHIVKVDRTSADLELHTTLGRGTRLGATTLSEQVKMLPPELGRPVAGINGDYFRRRPPYVGDPQSLQILRGELVRGPSDWPCFWIDPQGKPHAEKVVADFQIVWPDGTRISIGLNEPRSRDAAVLFTSVVGASTQTTGGREFVLERSGTNVWLPLQAQQTYRARVREIRDTGNSPLSPDSVVLSVGPQLLSRLPEVAPGALVQISLATSPDLSGVRTAIGGGPVIVRDGKRVAERFSRVRHPRVAVGWNRDYWFLVEVDGRQLGLSVGMTLEEWGDYLVKLGCEVALNLDGGGSSTCWVHGQVMNSPSEGQERGMGNALVVIQKVKK
jgi:hypothetical protein